MKRLRDLGVNLLGARNFAVQNLVTEVPSPRRRSHSAFRDCDRSGLAVSWRVDWTLAHSSASSFNARHELSHQCLWLAVCTLLDHGIVVEYHCVP